MHHAPAARANRIRKRDKVNNSCFFVNFALLNIKGLDRHTALLQNTVRVLPHHETPDIIGITETWHHPHITDHPPLRGYSWIGKPRTTNKNGCTGHGGIGFFIKDNLRTKVTEINTVNQHPDILWIQILSQTKTIYMAIVYSSPNNNTNHEEILKCLKRDVTILEKTGIPVIMGDMNAHLPMITGDKLDRPTTTRDTALKKFLTHAKYTPLTNKNQISSGDHFTYHGTTGRSIPDYVLAPESTAHVRDYKTHQHHDVGSDHRLCTGRLLTGKMSREDTWGTRESTHTKWTNENKAIYKKHLAFLVTNLESLKEEPASKQNINELAETITQNIYKALSLITKPVNNNNNKRQKTDTTTTEINITTQNKNRLINQLKAANKARENTKELWNNIHAAQKKLTQLTNEPFEFNNTKWWAKLTNIKTPEEAKTFWTAQKRLKNNNTKQFPTIIKHEGKHIHGSQDIFQHIQTFYTQISQNKDKVAQQFALDNGITQEKADMITKDINDEHAENTRCDKDSPKSALNNSKITNKEMDSSIDKSKNNKTPGYDNIPSECIKNLDTKTKEALLNLFNKMWELIYTPPKWQLALTTLLHKKGPESDIANYRPITLLTTLLKIWERILKNRLSILVGKSKSIPDHQMGSQKISSAYLAILIKRILLLGADENTGEVFSAQIDMNKAYNRVNRTKLWNILKNLGVHGNLWANIIATYSHAFEQIIIGAKTSEKACLARGLRQGSVLSPLLYIIYTSPLIISLLNTGTGAPLYIKSDDLLPCIMFVDDLETFALSINSLLKQWYAVRNYAIAHESVINYTKSSVTSSHSIVDLESLLEQQDLQLTPIRHGVVLGAKIDITEAILNTPGENTISTDVAYRIANTAIVRSQLHKKGLRRGAINTPAAIFITKISIPYKLTFGLSSLGLSDYSKLRLRQTLANFISDIIGLDKPLSDPLWLLYDTGLPDPVNIILLNELTAFVKATKGFLNPLCSKMITNCDPIKANLIRAAASWGSTLSALCRIQIKKLHAVVEGKQKTALYNEITTNSHSCLSKMDLRLTDNTPVYTAFNTPHHLIPTLLQVRHNIIFNIPDCRAQCFLCDRKEQQTYQHFVTSCTFNPFTTLRNKAIEVSSDSTVITWFTDPMIIPLAAILGGPPHGHPLDRLRAAQVIVLQLLQKLPLGLLTEHH